MEKCGFRYRRRERRVTIRLGLNRGGEDGREVQAALNDSFNFRDRPRPRELDPFLFSPRRGEKDYLYRQRVPSIYLLTGLGFAIGSDSARVSAGRDRYSGRAVFYKNTESIIQ